MKWPASDLSDLSDASDRSELPGGTRMRRDDARNLARMQQAIPEALACRPAVTFWIGVMSRFGGYGDWLVACAVGRAAKRHWRQQLPDETVGVCVLGIESTMPADIDVAANQPDIDVALRAGGAHWAARARVARPFFDVFYEAHYACRTTFKDRSRWLREQAEADARLDNYRWFYDGFPDSCARLAETGLDEFGLISATAGFEVSPDDLAIATEPPDLEGHETARKADLDAWQGCVTIHNGQGEGIGTKQLPPDVPEAIAAALARRGIRCVQLGVCHNRLEPPIRSAVDLRGLRFNESAYVQSRARLHVDCEGALVKLARAVGTRSVVFFGPTPRAVFGLAGNINYTRAICPEPWGPHCFWKKRGWSRRCPLGVAHCINLPQPETAVRIVLDALDAVEPTPSPATRVE